VLEERENPGVLSWKSFSFLGGRRESLEKKKETERKEPNKFATSAPIHLPKKKKPNHDSKNQ
jgi:hypothetical protein